MEFIGWASDAHLAELYRQAQALIFPAEEDFGIIPVEAMASGCPVIAFARGGMPEGIDHGKTGFLCNTIEELCGYIGRLWELDRAYCRAEAERRFSDSAIVTAYESLYRSLLS